MEQKKRRPTAQERRRGLIINALTLIVLILLIFEGKSLISLFSDESIQHRIQQEEQEVFASANLLPEETETEKQTEASAQTDSPPSAPSSSDAASDQSENTTEPETENRYKGLPDGSEENMTAVVPEQSVAIDDSYFTDAVFIGDSRMEGFRNFSGITKGSFVTAVGMELENIYSTPQIPTAKGTVLVMDALKNLNFSKIYMMLGTNELGAYDMDAVKESYRKVLNEVKTYANCTDPVIYV